MKVPPPLTIRVTATEPIDVWKELARKPGVFALEVSGQVTHLSATGNLGRRAARIMKSVPQSAGEVLIHCWPTGSKLQTSLLLYDLARKYFPATYLQRLHLRMPWFTSLLAQDQFPRLVVSNRLPPGARPVIGPFQSREAAQLYGERVQSAFLLRRCTETLLPSPDHPGCLYGEIKQCLRPCQCAVSGSEYGTEAATVASFLQDGGRRTVPALVAIRDQATQATDFEAAAKLHKQIEKLREAMSVGNSIATDLPTFHGIAIVLDPQAREVQLFPIAEGLWQGMTTLSFAEAGEGSASLEAVLRSRLEAASEGSNSNRVDALEHIALFSRWYFSSWRQGEWLPFAAPDQLPYRKLMRTVARLVRKQAGQVSAGESLTRMLA